MEVLVTEEFKKPLDTPRVRSPALAACLSLVPGLGHLYLDKKRKAAVLFLIDLSIFFGGYFTNWSLIGFVLFMPYLLVMIPAALESYHLANGKIGGFSESRPYIVLLLLTRGFFALPLLWQSHLFSNKNKVIGSILVPVFAVLYFGFIYFYGRTLLHLIQPILDKKT